MPSKKRYNDIYVFNSPKGGTGKTTAALSFFAYAKKQGWEPLLADSDIYIGDVLGTEDTARPAVFSSNPQEEREADFIFRTAQEGTPIILNMGGSSGSSYEAYEQIIRGITFKALAHQNIRIVEFFLVNGSWESVRMLVKSAAMLEEAPETVKRILVLNDGLRGFEPSWDYLLKDCLGFLEAKPTVEEYCQQHDIPIVNFPKTFGGILYQLSKAQLGFEEESVALFEDDWVTAGRYTHFITEYTAFYDRLFATEGEDKDLVPWLQPPPIKARKEASAPTSAVAASTK